LQFGEQAFTLEAFLSVTTKSFPQETHCLIMGARFARCSRSRFTHFSRFNK
jgi:hypothetical protein